MGNLPVSRQILVIIGPSGSGKSTVLRELHTRGLAEVTPSWTTRPPRTGEAEGSLEHVFVDEQEFDSRDRRGFFLKTVRMFKLPYRYGLPKLKIPPDGRIPVVMLRAPLVSLAREFYPNQTVYQIEGSLKQVRERLNERSDADRQGSRLDDYRREIAAGRAVADRVFRNDSGLSRTVDAVADALEKDFGS